VTLSFTNEGGFTREDFLAAVREGYEKIYEEERETSSIPEGQASPELLNRNRTNGKHGIWGHDLGDLSLDSVYTKDGVWRLVVSS
jgi:hypothetical protein